MNVSNFPHDQLLARRSPMRTIATIGKPTWIGLCLVPLLGLLGCQGGMSRPTAAGGGYEVWITDQSDKAKESGGYLYIYDGATLSADPTGAKPKVTMDLAGDVNRLCQEATQRPV